MSRESVIADLKQFVVAELLNGKGEGLDETTPLLDWGIIDSIGIVALRQFVFSRFGVLIPNADLRPTNLTSLATIAEMVERLQTAANG